MTTKEQGYKTIGAAKREMTPAARKAHNARVFQLENGRFELYPLGHPVPQGAVAVTKAGE